MKSILPETDRPLIAELSVRGRLPGRLPAASWTTFGSVTSVCSGESETSQKLIKKGEIKKKEMG